MKTSFFLICLSIGLSCSENMKADIFKMNVSDFNAVSLKIPADVVWTDTDMASCVVECTKDQESKIEVVMEDKTLIIKSKGNNWGDWDSNNGKITIKLSSRQLKKVAIHGSGDFEMRSPNDDPEFEYSIHGSGDLRAKVQAEKCEGTINGSGDVSITGKSNQFDLSINGSGDVKALDFACKSVTVHIAGSGDAKVNATESLSVKIAGSGDVQYSGDPKKVNQKVAGSGELRKI